MGDILLWGDKLARYIDGMDEASFLADEKTQDAATKWAESIGNAAKQVLTIDPAFDLKYPAARRAAACASRIRLSHGYFSIDNTILWNTVSRSIPGTVAAIRAALQAL